MTGAEILVDHPLQKDALEPLQAERLAFAGRGESGDVEVAEQIAVQVVQVETRTPVCGTVRSFGKNVSRSPPCGFGCGAAI